MSALNDMTIPLLPDRYYHIYNRGIAKQAIFFNDGNYKYFLQKFGEKLSGYCNTYAYCLLVNHFHFFIQPLSQEEILAQACNDFSVVNVTFLKDYVIPWTRRVGLDSSVIDEADLTNFINLLNLYHLYGDTQSNPDHQPANLSSSGFGNQICAWVISERIRGFMLGYAKAVNKQQRRTGSLFQKGFRRKNVPDLLSEKRMVLCYIHHNPIHHFYTDRYENYPWSSYNTYLSYSQTKLKRDAVMKWFGSQEGLVNLAEEYRAKKKSFNWTIEED